MLAMKAVQLMSEPLDLWCCLTKTDNLTDESILSYFLKSRRAMFLVYNNTKILIKF